MKERKTVYCEMAFLLNFLKNRPVDTDFEDYKEDCWKGLGRFLKRSDLIIDVTKEEFVQYCIEEAKDVDEERKNKFLKSIIMKSEQGEINLSFKDKFLDIKNISSNNLGVIELNAVFLTTSEDSICQKRSEAYGVIALNTKGVYSSIHLFIDSGIAFPDLNNRKWDFLNTLNEGIPLLRNCNSMLMVDNFICSDSKDNNGRITVSYQDKIKYNLAPIFKSLLPESLADDLKYEISIFTGSKNDDNFENAYNSIRTIISILRPNLNFSLTLYNKAKLEFHDRTIVTNNVWIGCGEGFDLFDKKGNIRKPTTVTVTFPHFSKDINWANNAFINLIKSANNIIGRYHIENRDFWGSADHKNRIVSYYITGEMAEKKQKRCDHNPPANRFSRPYGWG